MSEDNGYNGGSVNGRTPNHLIRTSGRKPLFFSTRQAAIAYHIDRKNQRKADHVKTAERAEYLNGHTSGVPFFQAATPGNERAKNLLRIMNLTEEERHEEIEGVLPKDYQQGHEITVDPKELEHNVDDQRQPYKWLRNAS